MFWEGYGYKYPRQCSVWVVFRLLHKPPHSVLGRLVFGSKNTQLGKPQLGKLEDRCVFRGWSGVSNKYLVLQESIFN